MTFSNLKKLDLLTEQSVPRKSNFATLSRRLSLVPKQSDDFDLKNPSDLSYVFSGAYSPIPCKLVEQVCTKSGP